jgi:organic hydroperoxide reductase OsmC/OhrA
MRSKEFSFPVSVEWLGDTRVATRVEGKREIETSSPPEFRGQNATLWSPEDFFVAAAASCLAITLQGIAGHRGLPLHSLEVSGDGTVGKREDGRFGFSRLAILIEIETEPGHEEQARQLAREAEETCLVAVSLALPIETTVEVQTAPPSA